MEKILNKKSLFKSINKVPKMYPWLSKNEECAVCIIGAGITGALTALRFASENIDTILVSADPIGYGSTSDSTGTMKFNIYKGLYELSKNIGLDNAVKLYKRCEKAIDAIEGISNSLGSNICDFKKMDLLTFTSDPNKIDDIHREYLLLRRNGFDVKLVNKSSFDDMFDFEVGIVGNKLAAVADPYLLVHEVTRLAEKSGARIYENTCVEKILEDDTGVEILTDKNYKIKAGNMISALGADTQNLLELGNIKKTTFIVSTEESVNLDEENKKYLIESIDSPRTSYYITKKDRAVAYGLDSGLVNRERGRVSGIIPIDSFEDKKYKDLEESIPCIFPGTFYSDAEYAFSSDYIQTKNGLPVIAKLDGYNKCIAAFSSGKDKIVFAEIISSLLLDLYKDKYNELLDIILKND